MERQHSLCSSEERHLRKCVLGGGRPLLQPWRCPLWVLVADTFPIRGRPPQLLERLLDWLCACQALVFSFFIFGFWAFPFLGSVLNTLSLKIIHVPSLRQSCRFLGWHNANTMLFSGALEACYPDRLKTTEWVTVLEAGSLKSRFGVGPALWRF